jgi:hypothetical protein
MTDVYTYASGPDSAHTLEPDRDQIEIFVDALFRHASHRGFASSRAFHEASQKVYRIAPIPLLGGLRFLIDAAVDHARSAAQYSDPIVYCPPIAVFANKETAREKDTSEGLALSVECDANPQTAKIRLEQILGPTTLTVASGGTWTDPATGEVENKLHLHWRLQVPARSAEELAKLKQARTIATEIVGGDASNKPVCHPIRWPGSWHRKATPVLCQITEQNPDTEIDLATAVEALEAFAPPRRNGKNHDSPFDPALWGGPANDWGEMIRGVLSGENYHEALAVMAAKFVSVGTHRNAAADFLRGMMESTAGPRDDRWLSRYNDIDRAVQTAGDKYVKAGTRPVPKPKVYWHGDVDPRESRPFLISKVLPEVGHGLIAGQWGTYKTFVALAIALAVMTGRDFIEFPVRRRGGVLFIAPEGSSEIAARIEGALMAQGGQERLPFAWVEVCPPLISPDAAKVITAQAKEIAEQMMAKWGLPLVLIIIDTVVTTAGYTKDGQDNDTASAQRIMTTLQTVASDTRACAIGVDHFGKSVDTGTRGSSAKEGSTDFVLALLGERTVAGTVSNSRLALRKRRGGRNGEEFPFTTRVIELGTNQYGETETTLAIDWASEGARTIVGESRPWSKSLRLFQQCLSTALADLGKQQRPYADGPIVQAVDMEAVRAEFQKSYPAEGDDKQKHEAARKAFKRAILLAQGNKLIGVRILAGTTWVWLATEEGPQRQQKETKR